MRLTRGRYDSIWAGTVLYAASEKSRCFLVRTGLDNGRESGAWKVGRDGLPSAQGIGAGRELWNLYRSFDRRWNFQRLVRGARPAMHYQEFL